MVASTANIDNTYVDKSATRRPQHRRDLTRKTQCLHREMIKQNSPINRVFISFIVIVRWRHHVIRDVIRRWRRIMEHTGSVIHMRRMVAHGGCQRSVPHMWIVH